MAAIATSAEPIDFPSLLSALRLTKGNLSSHLKRLEQESFIEVKKEFVNRIPRTSYRCTERGRETMRAYLRSVENLLNNV